MKGPLDIHQHLLAHDVRHEIVRLPRTAPSAPSLAEALGLPAHRCVAVHPFHATTATGDLLAVVLAPADLEIDNDSMAGSLSELLRVRLGESARFTLASATLVSKHTDYLAGHVAPLLLPPGVIVVAVQPLVDLAATIVYTATGDAGTALALRALDLLVLTRAIVVPERRRTARRRPITIDLEQAPAPDRVEVAARQHGSTGRPGAVVTKAAS